MTERPVKYRVMRQDDNGNKFVVGRDMTRKEADDWCASLTVRGHKQIYWVEEGPCDSERPVPKTMRRPAESP